MNIKIQRTAIPLHKPEPTMGNLFEELKRRKVVRVAGVYAVVAWLLIQVANNVVPALQLPAWTNGFIVLLLLIGFPIALVLAWAYEVTPEGIKPDSGNQSSAQIAAPLNQKLIYAMFALLLLVAGFQIADRFLEDTDGVENSPRTNVLLDETRVDIVTPATDAPTDFALAPDGRQIVFVASDDSGVSLLWLRSLATTTAQPLAGTEGAQQPFWSPDGSAIGFFAGNTLKRLDLGGGAPQSLTTIVTPRGASWGADTTLLFSPNFSGPLLRLSTTGGEVTAATTLEPGQWSHRNPSFLPDGRRFLFYALGKQDQAGIYLGHLDGTAPVRLTAADSAGVLHPDGWLLWQRAGTLTAQRLHLAQAALTGEPLTLADGVADNEIGLGALSVASTGLIAYRTGAVRQRQLTWLDRSGTLLGTLGEPDGTMSAPWLSPDGLRVAVHRTVQSNQDIWLLDGARTSRFTFDATGDQFPLGSPDGSRIVFRSARTGAGDLYQKSTSGAGEETLLVGSDQSKTPSNWSADGRFLFYTSFSPQTGSDLWALPMTVDPVPFLVLQTPFAEGWGTLSSDGRWIAYSSNESGRYEVYVRPFAAPDANAAPAAAMGGGQWQISTAGGLFPAWKPDGLELYYVDPGGNMLAVQLIVTGDKVEVGTPEVLFSTRILGGGTDTGRGQQFDVALDGRFLINTLTAEGATDPITLIQNWNPEAAQ